MEENNNMAPAPAQQASQNPSAVPNSDYPIQLDIQYPETSSRGLALATLFVFIKPILLIPHIIILYLLSVFALVGMVVSQVYVLFTGRFPRSIFELQRGIMLWQNRVNGYIFGLTDKYPPFEFEPQDRTGAIKAIKKLVIAVIILIVLFIILAVISN